MSEGQLNPLISVVIPIHNRMNLANRAVKSVLEQTYVNFELILVDDGSSPPFVSDHSDNRIKIIRLDKNVGGGSARNIGVDAACGSLVSFLDSDDLWLDCKLQHQVHLISMLRNNAWFGYNAVKMITPSKERVVPARPFNSKHDSISDFLIADENLIQTSGFIAPRSIFKQFPFNASLRRHQDWDLLLRLHEANIEMIFFPEPDVIWFADGTDLTRVSSGSDPGPTISWLKTNSAILSRRAKAKILATLIAPKQLKDHPLEAFSNFLKGFMLDPNLIFKALKKIAKYKISKGGR